MPLKEVLGKSSGAVRTIGEFDWSRTPLGDSATWPQKLRSAVSEAIEAKPEPAFQVAKQTQPGDVSAELEAMNRLYQVSEKIVQAGNDLHLNLEFIVDTAIALSGADKGNIQVLDDKTNLMRIAAQRGFDASFLAFFREVAPEDASACAAAMVSRKQMVVEDVLHSPLFAGQPSLSVMCDADVRAVQSTPLLSSSGSVCGMISTHYCCPRKATERELRLLNLLARLTADYLERKRAEGMIADSQLCMRAFLENSAIVGWLKDEDLRFTFMSENFKKRFSAQDWLGKTDYDVWPREIADQFRCNDQAVLDSDAPVEAIERTLDTNGGVAWWFTNKFTYRNAAGRRYVGGLAVDITAWRAAVAQKSYLAAIVANSAEAIYSITPDQKVTSWNAAAERLFGHRADDMIGSSLARIIPADRVAEMEEVLARLQQGEASQSFESVRLRKDGQRIDVTMAVSPIRDETGRVVGASMIVHDISEQKRALERERTLMREVNHRSKNMLSLVQAIARHTAASDPADFIARFEARLQSLYVAQNLLIKHDWNDVPLLDLVKLQLCHFSDMFGERISIGGPALRVRPKSAQAIGMALHELATNAAKYGSLSVEAGRVDICWTLGDVDGKSLFTLSWTESGGPPVSEPERRGFGSDVTGRLLKLRFDAEVETDFAVDGLSWQLRVAADKIMENAAGSGSPQKVVSAASRMEKGRRILVVEDEAITALDIENCLRRAGFEVVGPVSSASQALDMIDGPGCDAAVLDVTLTDGSVEPVASRLDLERIPYVVVSGYSREQLPQMLQNASVIAKPFDVEGLIAEVEGCLG